MATVLDQSTTISFPIVKAEETPAGDLLVYGKATDGSVDSDEQIVDPEWSGKALSDWLATGGNLRVQHNPHRDPAGVGVEVEVDKDGGHWVKGLVVEPTAKELVRKGALRAYSVGIMRPQIVHDNQARGGRIVGGEIGELSLVDRPANRNCGVTLVKAAKDGTPTWVGTVFGEESVQRTSFSPADMAKMVNDGGAAIVKRDMDPDVGGGVDKDKIPAQDFAGRDRSFPIVTPGDVSDAASSIGRAGPDNYSPGKLRANITRIAHRKGPDFVAELPEAWRESTKAEKPNEDDKKPFPGAAPEFGKKPKKRKKAEKDDGPGEHDKQSEPETDDEPVEKSNATCKGCGKILKAKHQFCPKCGMGVKADKAASPKGKDKKTKPVPAHREPDGPQGEIFERDAHMEDGDEKREGTKEPTPTWDKSAALHDVLCPAYRMADVRAVHGLKSVREAVHADFADVGLRDLAAALRDTDAGAVKAARKALRKGFTDMYPTAHPTPTAMTPGRFNRPYLSAGHPPAAAQAAGSQLHPGANFRQVDAGDFDRGALTAGHERPSPASKGVDGGAVYASAVQAQAVNAMRALHDHISVTRPELCPLAHTPVHAVGQGVPSASKSGKKLRRQAKTIKRLEKQLGELAAQPDPNAAPVRGILTKHASGGAGPVDRRSLVDEANEREYEQYLQGITKSGDPVQREHARAVLNKMQH